MRKSIRMPEGGLSLTAIRTASLHRRRQHEGPNSLHFGVDRIDAAIEDRLTERNLNAAAALSLGCVTASCTKSSVCKVGFGSQSLAVHVRVRPELASDS